MNLHFDEDLVEAAVFLCARGERKGVASFQIARFNREREKLYAILDPDDRNAAFFKLHLDWFREWGLEKLLTDPLRDFPFLAGGLKLLAFRKAQGKKDEGAELYVNQAGARHGVVSISPERFRQERSLNSFLRHELTHLHDMIDPAFGYVPELRLPESSVSQQRLARERYRVLWDITIEGRLSRASAHPITTRERRWLEFTAGFTFWTQAQQEEIFEALWSHPAPTHKSLEQLVCDPRHLQPNSGPKPGGHCPLCAFPTFAWAEAAALPVSELGAIQAEFPRWAPQHGLCARCASIYRAGALRKPAVL